MRRCYRARHPSEHVVNDLEGEGRYPSSGFVREGDEKEKPEDYAVRKVGRSALHVVYGHASQERSDIRGSATTESALFCMSAGLLTS